MNSETSEKRRKAREYMRIYREKKLNDNIVKIDYKKNKIRNQENNALVGKKKRKSEHNRTYYQQHCAERKVDYEKKQKGEESCSLNAPNPEEDGKSLEEIDVDPFEDGNPNIKKMKKD